MPLEYLIARLSRRYLPQGMVRFLLRRGWIIKPGLETANPVMAVDRYQQVLEAHGIALEGKRVLDFGYGGHLAVGAELLRRGAAHVVLCDPFAPLDDPRNRRLWPRYQEFLEWRDGRVFPRPACFTLLHQDVRDLYPGDLPACDLVLSSSVYEHLDDPEEVTRALVRLTRPDGVHLHFVDLRDHFFKYPFEMLCYSEKVWRRWLNPTSNLNRYRLWDYRRVFERYFEEVEITVLARDEAALRQARPRIRPEFLSGDEAQDAVTLIQVFLRNPKHTLA